MTGQGQPEPKTLGQVVGENLARLRAGRGLTQREMAGVLDSRYLPWTYAMVASLESGRRASIDPESLVLLSWLLEVPLAFWFEGDGLVRLSDDYVVTREELRQSLRESDRRPPNVGATTERALTQDRDPTFAGLMEVDNAIARRLGVSVAEVMDAAEKLWGFPATSERDRRLGPVEGLAKDTVRSRRGHITRELIKELEPHVKKPARRARRSAR